MQLLIPGTIALGPFTRIVLPSPWLKHWRSLWWLRCFIW